LFVLNQKAELKKALQELINKNWRFVGQSSDVGQVFVYRPLDLPYEIIVTPGKDTKGNQNFEIRDPHQTRQFYNAAQLAIAVCSILDKGGDQGVEEFVRLHERFVNRDYHVILAAGPNQDILREFADALKAELANEQIEPETRGLLKRVNE